MSGIGRRDVMQGMVLGAAGMTALVVMDATQAATGPGPGTPGHGAASSKEAEEIIGLANALEAAEGAKDPDAWAKLVAEDYTEINGRFAVILKGRDTGKRFQEFAKATPHVIVGSFLSNPNVQIWGDLAVLCYVSMRSVRDKEGRSDPACRRVTRIYNKEKGGWILVHSHFSSYDYLSTY